MSENQTPWAAAAEELAKWEPHHGQLSDGGQWFRRVGSIVERACLAHASDLRAENERLAAELKDEQERHQASLKLLRNADSEFEKVMDQRDALAAKVEQLREMLEKCRAFANMSPLTLEQLNTVLIETRPDAPTPAVVPDLHKTVSRNWQKELEHDNAVLRAALQRVWDEDECGFIIGTDTIECGKCNGKAKTAAEIVHEDYCTQGFIHQALEETKSVEVVPSEDVEPLIASVCEMITDNRGETRNKVRDALAAFRKKHPKPESKA